MNIALIANDARNELMVHFCIAHKRVFKKHTLYSTATTGRLISEASGLSVNSFPAHCGGEQQVSARIVCKEIDLLILFRDPLISDVEKREAEMLHLCDLYNVRLATNVNTAEMLICGLSHGNRIEYFPF